ncbi:3-hydroxybenzoate 4-monooxygenase [Methylobacterium mesophilicum SR1.6/6]|uniref:3-hydroxybenzoate 4-monooxygenase n=1 Tax=Methylobacterium mesophilicum SR1.6/6 TaxID=908290 RepID=A0A6B9FSZ6_9HYPH|nr:FAD-binding monooxygenase [Methylobacterium mesophilicum]QGY04228.1 3-hydroxybenzoate 4-monooxygenase [Methylobacterium mesophilicum SR1.6/6]
MQFHLNGYKSGDPAIAESSAAGKAPHPDGVMPELVDVLIVGCGPTGLTLAAQLAAFPDITTRIIDRKRGRLLVGQADGIACRTMEMFEAFGFSERVLKEAYWVNETCFWNPDPSQPDVITRTGRIVDTEDGLSEFPHVIMNQARVHDFFLTTMQNAPTRLEPSYGRSFLDLALTDAEAGDGIETPSGSDHPVAVRLERIDASQTPAIETIRAQYVVGCDGAHSAVRGALGLTVHGDSANQAWGVMDVLAVTTFPDIRLKAAIHSANEGSLLIIPREGGYLVRMYIELDKLDVNRRLARDAVTVDHLIAAARRILHPYLLEVKEVPWWSVYEIGQRLCEAFDDVGPADREVRSPRIFIAGDACHTHSPKAGQGMNVSMQDAFNLGWKLAAVIRGQCTPRILQTYSTERRAVAQELIDFDRAFARMFSVPPRPSGATGGDGVDPAEFERYFVKHGRFTAGTETCYPPSLLTGQPTHQNLAEGFTIGMRLHSAPVIRLADAKPLQLGHTVKADGRWRLFLFADPAPPDAQSSRLRALCTYLAEADDAPIRRFTPAGADIDSVIDVRAILQQDHRQVVLGATPPLLRPSKGRYGLVDCEKVFCPDPKAGDIFALRGIRRADGCIVVVRPDQHVAHVLPLDAGTELAAFFDRFML